MASIDKNVVTRSPMLESAIDSAVLVRVASVAVSVRALNVGCGLTRVDLRMRNFLADVGKAVCNAGAVRAGDHGAAAGVYPNTPSRKCITRVFAFKVGYGPTN